MTATGETPQRIAALAKRKRATSIATAVAGRPANSPSEQTLRTLRHRIWISLLSPPYLSPPPPISPLLCRSPALSRRQESQAINHKRHECLKRADPALLWVGRDGRDR